MATTVLSAHIKLKCTDAQGEPTRIKLDSQLVNHVLPDTIAPRLQSYPLYAQQEITVLQALPCQSSAPREHMEAV
jgi:hypothetical protein